MCVKYTLAIFAFVLIWPSAIKSSTIIVVVAGTFICLNHVIGGLSSRSKTGGVTQSLVLRILLPPLPQYCRLASLRVQGGPLEVLAVFVSKYVFESYVSRPHPL